MIKHLFQSKDLIDDDSAQWIFDVFEWATTCFDKEEFVQRSVLVQPSNEYFPGKVENQHQLAENIFNRTLQYAGLQGWPFVLVKPDEFMPLPPPNLNISPTTAIHRNSQTPRLLPCKAEAQLKLSYRPEQTGKPADLSSNFAHLIAQHLVMQSGNLPPGGNDLVLPATEVLAIYLGFGVLFANSAYAFRGGCGSCYNAKANRQSSLTEDETVFTLALYCHKKRISKRDATRYLKPHLKTSYQRAIKQIEKIS